jgi:hypothetical protein
MDFQSKKCLILIPLFILLYASLCAQQNSMMLTRKGWSYQQGGVKIKRKEAFNLLKTNNESAPYFKNARIYSNIGGAFALVGAILNFSVTSQIASSGTILTAKEKDEISKKQNTALALTALGIPFYIASSVQVKKSVAAYNGSLAYFKPKKTEFDLQVGITSLGLRMRF